VGIAQNYTIILLVKAMTCFSGLYDALWCSVHNMHNLLRQCQVAPFANPLWYATSATLRSEPLVLSTRHCIALSGRWPADIPQVRNLKPHIQIPSKAYIQSL
jgi:hypothetical protein